VTFLNEGRCRSLVIGAILTAAILAACGDSPGIVFRTTLSTPDGQVPLPVTLGDKTGLVVGIGPAQVDPVEFRDAGVLADPTDPNAFILTWLGGMCDNDAAVVFRPTASGYDLQLEVDEKLSLGCPAAGVLRALHVETSEPIPVGAVTISGARTIQLILDEDCGPLTTAATNDAKVACLALIQATIGDRTDDFALVTVWPDDGACPGTECSTAAGIAAQPWHVEATDRKGQPHAWRCTYRDETASCAVVTAPSSH
jgi:hypothetical protein